MSNTRLEKLCRKGSSSLRLKDVPGGGSYKVYGAPGVVGYSDNYQFKEPYIAIIKDGAGVGRVSICEGESSILGTIQALLPAKETSIDYLSHLLRSLHLEAYASGATIPHIYFKDYGKQEVKRRNYTDQLSIAQILDLPINLICKQKKFLELLNQLVKSRFIEMFGDGNWTVISLSQCVAEIESGKSPRCMTEPRTDRAPAVLKLSAVSSGTYLEGENKQLLPGELIVEAKEVKAGDILLARKNTPELVGKSVYVARTDGGIMFPDIIFRMRPLPAVNAVYLSYFLAGSAFDSIRSLAHGSAKSMSNIPKTELSKLPVFLPPLALQQEFASFAQQVDKLKFETQQSIDKLQMLYDSLSQEYFGKQEV